MYILGLFPIHYTNTLLLPQLGPFCRIVIIIKLCNIIIIIDYYDYYMYVYVRMRVLYNPWSNLFGIFFFKNFFFLDNVVGKPGHI